MSKNEEADFIKYRDTDYGYDYDSEEQNPDPVNETYQFENEEEYLIDKYENIDIKTLTDMKILAVLRALNTNKNTQGTYQNINILTDIIKMLKGENNE